MSAIPSRLLIICLLLSGSKLCFAQELPPLIQQLGNPSFQKRIDAENQLLEAGAESLRQVNIGVNSTDPEIRRRSVRLISQLQRIAFLRQRDKIRQNPWAVDPVLVPAWEYFQEVAGDNEGSRKIYSEMLDAEPDLMQAVGTNPGNWSQELDSRCIDMSRVLGVRGAKMIRPINLITLTLLATHPDCILSPVSAGSLMALLSDGDFASSLKQLPDDERETCRTILGRWVQEASHSSPASRLQLATLYQLPEGRFPAREFLESRKTLGGTLGQLQNAIHFLASFGDETDVPLLEALLDPTRLGSALHESSETPPLDFKSSSLSGLEVDSSSKTEDLRVNDAALFALTSVMKLNPLDFGFSRGQLDPMGKPSVRMPATFPNENQRVKAMSQWLEWRTQNSLQLRRSVSPYHSDLDF